MQDKIKILFFDEEVSPMLSWTYGIYQTNVIKVERQSHMFCFSYKWLEDKEVKIVSQIDFPARYKKSRNDDYDVVRELWNLLDQADIVIAHNARGFDVKVAMGRFLVHGFPPPSPFVVVEYCKNDTYLLEKLYLKVRPFINNHPNIAQISQRPDICPKCGHNHFKSYGRRGLYRRLRCKKCKGWIRERIVDREEIVRPTYVNA